MSVIQISNVLRFSAAKGSARLVLIALADVANDDGEVTAYARGRKALASKANCDEATVKRSIKALAALGELKVLKVGDGRVSSDYQLALGPPNEGGQVTPAPGADDPPTEGKENTLGVSDAPPISPSLSVDDPSLSITPAAQSIEEQFAEFYAAFPRRIGRGHAVKAYRAALKKVSAAVLLEAAHRYADVVKGKEARYIAHPATWLNGERWADELEAPAAGKGHGRAIDTDRDAPTGAVNF